LFEPEPSKPFRHILWDRSNRQAADSYSPGAALCPGWLELRRLPGSPQDLRRSKSKGDMKKTVEISDSLLREAQRLAAREGVTLRT
jgi:hypothetical protein